MAFAEALLLFVGMTGAQLYAVPLAGRATGPDGMALPGVEIVIAGDGAESTVVTDEQGRFQVADLFFQLGDALLLLLGVSQAGLA